jgi:hypothetical protein
MRSWQLVSATAVVMMATALSSAIGLAQSATDRQRHNEFTLAGLRPGVSKLSSTNSKLGGLGRPATRDATGVDWWASCYGDSVHVEEDANRTVQAITVSALAPQAGDCFRSDASLRRDMRSGRGLELGDSCGRVTELYGKPESRGPSVRGSRKLESLFYSFDWAGEDVPQSMEVSCDSASGRVVEITLAASTL